MNTMSRMRCFNRLSTSDCSHPKEQNFQISVLKHRSAHRCHNSYSLRVSMSQNLASPSPDPAKPPFSLLSTSVYSLATHNSQGTDRTLNLVTYASPVSILPRFYALGLYKGTLSAQNMLETGIGVLTILAAHHAPLFELLGKTSGRNVDKLEELQLRGYKLREYADQYIIDDCIGALKLKINPAVPPMPAGDHDVVLCSVEEFDTFNPTSQPLYTEVLRRQGYI